LKAEWVLIANLVRLSCSSQLNPLPGDNQEQSGFMTSFDESRWFKASPKRNESLAGGSSNSFLKVGGVNSYDNQLEGWWLE